MKKYFIFLHPSPQHTDLRQFTLVFLVKRQVLTMIEQLLPHQHCYWTQFDCWHRLCAFRGQSSQRRGVGWGDHWMDQRMLDRHSSQPLVLFEYCRNINVHVCVHMCVCLKFNVFREELQENFAKVKIVTTFFSLHSIRINMVHPKWYEGLATMYYLPWYTMS